MGSIGASLLSGLVLASSLATGAVAASAVTARTAGHTATAGTVATNTTTGYLEGIDVSHWQSTINWTSVAAAGKSFAIIKATEGRLYTDPNYATNRAAAQAAGLWTGAYHFANPDTTAGDAIGEADRFVSTIKLGRGDLIPALDLEQSGGLSVSALQSWVASWLGEVSRKIGVKPMIYTSPAFWQRYMGDSHALADAGYKTLWIAHWGAASPSIPANNWGGHGWTFWQYTDCGVVPGISGCVDLDRYHGTDLLQQAYSIFSLTAASAGQVKQGQEAAAAATVGIARTNFPMQVDLAVAGLPSGASAAFNASPTTDTTSRLQVTTDAAKTPTGTYPLTITGTGQGLTRTTRVSLVVADGVPPVIVTPTMWLEPNVIVAPTSVPVYTVWSASDPSGVASYGLQRTTNGGSTWSTVALPTATTRAVWQWLAVGSTAMHRVRATDGKANTSAWLAGPSASVLLTEETATSIHFSGSWVRSGNALAHGSSTRYSLSAGASASYTFTGSSIGWVATRGPNRGSAKVYIDGVYAGTVNLHATAFQWRRVVFARNWTTAATHTIRIVAADARHPIVDVDAFIRLWRH